MENREVAIRLSGVKKRYKLGQIGGGTLQGDLQSWWARIRGKEDPNTMIGTDQRLIGKTFMALNGIDLTVYKGEALGIIGGNGAGKSTMLKLLSRVTAPTEGEIDIYGRITSMLEVGTGFNGEMTGRENVYLNGAILGMTKAEIDAKMEEIIEFSEVREFIDTPVKRYSSGMYVKLAFSVAAHLDSEIMIMDEVLAVGDMAFQKKCLDKMRDAAKKEGRTVLYVSHNMNTIRQLCDRCVVLDKGKVVFEGAVEESIGVYMHKEHPTRQTYADFSNTKRNEESYGLIAKILHLSLSGLKEPRIALGDTLPFQISLWCIRPMNDVCMRFMVYYKDGTPVCMGTSRNESMKLCEGTNVMNGNLEISCLAPGSYYLKMALYGVDQFGVEALYDVVDHAIWFAVGDEDMTNNLIWSHNWWGHVRLGDVKME